IGEGLCFLINAVSFLAVLAALLSMKISPANRQAPSNGIVQGFKEGFDYAFGFRPIKYILMLLALVSIMGMPYAVLMPVVAKDILRGGAHTLGFLMGAKGVGAVTGALYLASRRTVVGLGRWIPIAAGIFGTGLVALSFSRSMSLSM